MNFKDIKKFEKFASIREKIGGHNLLTNKSFHNFLHQNLNTLDKSAFLCYHVLDEENFIKY